MSSTKIISWNVNGIRAIIKKDFLKDIKEINPDIICIQETKAGDEDALKALTFLEGYKIYINSSKARKGYSGTAILSKKEPLNVSYDCNLTVRGRSAARRAPGGGLQDLEDHFID